MIYSCRGNSLGKFTLTGRVWTSSMGAISLNSTESPRLNDLLLSDLKSIASGGLILPMKLVRHFSWSFSPFRHFFRLAC